MTPVSLSMRPSRSVNWADDEEDSFDYESWKATVDTSAPTVEDLGPLQPPCIEDDSPHLFSVSMITNKPSSRAAAQDQSLCTSRSSMRSTELVSTDRTPTIDFAELQCIDAQQWFVSFALDQDPAPPAYPELSHYNDGVASPYIRTNYTQNWNQMKSASGQDCRQAVQFRYSPLSQVTLVDDQQIEPAVSQEMFENSSEVALEDVPDLQDEDNSEEDGDGEETMAPITSSSAPIFREMNGEALAFLDAPSIGAWDDTKDVTASISLGVLGVRTPA